MPNEAPIQVKTKLKIFSGLSSLVLYFCVFFILLIFFMLSSNFVPIRGVEVNMPRIGGRLVYASRNFVVTVDKESRIYFNDVVVKDVGELKHQLSVLLDSGNYQRDKERIIIRSDVNAPLATVAEILSVAEELNLNAIIMSGGQPRGRTATFTEPES